MQSVPQAGNYRFLYHRGTETRRITGARKRTNGHRLLGAARCIGGAVMNELAGGQRNGLAVVAEHVFNLDGVGVNPHDLVTAIDDFALGGDKDVITLSEKHLGGLAGAAGEAYELQGDWRWRRRARRLRWWRR